jgi:hypothetical protein
VLFVSTASTDFMGQHSSLFFTKTVVNAQQLLLQVLLLMAPFYDDGASTTAPAATHAAHKRLPGVCAMELARVCVELESWGIAHIQGIVQQLSALIAHHQHAEIPFAVADLQKRLVHTSRKLLTHYVKCQGDKLSQMVRQAILTPNWLKAKLPRDVRPGMEMLVDEVRQMAAEVGQVFDQTTSTELSSSDLARASQSRDSRLRASRFELNIGNLFEKKVQIFGAVAGDRESIMLGILKICLKSLQECVRLRTFSRNGYQQIQVDLYYVAHCLRPLAAKDEQLFNRLLDDILSSAGERCVEAQPAMELGIIESICQHKLEQRVAAS